MNHVPLTIRGPNGVSGTTEVCGSPAPTRRRNRQPALLVEHPKKSLLPPHPEFIRSVHITGLHGLAPVGCATCSNPLQIDHHKGTFRLWGIGILPRSTGHGHRSGQNRCFDGAGVCSALIMWASFSDHQHRGEARWPKPNLMFHLRGLPRHFPSSRAM